MDKVKTSLLYGAVAFGSVYLTITVIDKTADFWQWSVDRAYVQARTMERLCAADGYKPTACQKHNENTGHVLVR